MVERLSEKANGDDNATLKDLIPRHAGYGGEQRCDDNPLNRNDDLGWGDDVLGEFRASRTGIMARQKYKH